MAISFQNPLFAEDKEIETNWVINWKADMVLDETLVIEEVPLTGNTGKLKVVATSFRYLEKRKRKENETRNFQSFSDTRFIRATRTVLKQAHFT